MKKILLIIVLLLSSNIFAQSYIIINKNTGGKTVYKISEIDSISFVVCPDSISYDGKVYHTIFLQTQCWLRENLNVGTMLNGSNYQTDTGNIEKYCYSNDTNNCNTYGGLYQWAEAVQYKNGTTNFSLSDSAFSGNVQGICPTGWHIPTSAEFQTLATTVGNDGNSLKAIGQGSGDGAGTNTSGFSALLAGIRSNTGIFVEPGNTAVFWTSTENNAINASNIYLNDNTSAIGLSNYNKESGYSVRCVKD